MLTLAILSTCLVGIGIISNIIKEESSVNVVLMILGAALFLTTIWVLYAHTCSHT